jgi:hypothetical protein
MQQGCIFDRTVPAPHVLGQLVSRNVLVGVQSEHAEDDGLLVPADRGRRAVHEQLERPQDVDADRRRAAAGQLGGIDAQGGGKGSERGFAGGGGASLF